MSAIAVPVPGPAPPASWTGRTFVSVPFDYLLIGGGLSLVASALVLGLVGFDHAAMAAALPTVVLLANAAHFAASTLRLYTKPGAMREMSFLTRELPLVTVLVLTMFMAFPEALGHHLWSLYLTWSPYHYAAQTYGLALMYCYRSGCRLSEVDRKLLRAACLLPFFAAFLQGTDAGLSWLLPAGLAESPGVISLRSTGLRLLEPVAFAAPLALLARVRWIGGAPMPLITPLLLVTNSVWWFTLQYYQAFTLATVFHGIQYLAVVLVFHVRERMQGPGPRRPWWAHAALFYGACLALGFALFHLWPRAYMLAGVSGAQSVLLVIAAINVHHFVVDAYIWRLRRDRNMAVVAPAAA